LLLINDNIQFMKISAVLLKLLNVAYFFAILVLTLSVIFLLYVIFGPELEYPFDMFKEYMIIKSKNEFILFLTPAILIAALNTYLFSIIIKLVQNLVTEELFTRFQIAGFKLVGQLLMFITVLDAVLEFIYRIIFNSRITIQFSFTDFWIYISIGLFFIFLSGIFKKAKDLKEENELTV